MTRPDPARPALQIVRGPDDMAAAAAAFIVEALAGAVRERGVAHWCTTGGSSAPGIYRALRSAPLRDRLDWSRVHTWWGDDRFVAIGDPLCNATPFDTILREPGVGLPIADAHVHAMPITPVLASGGSPADAAAAYEAELRAYGPAVGLEGVPAFDLIILGVGTDGHILSVFSDSPVFDDPAWVSAVPAPAHIRPHLARVTINPRLVVAARSVLVATTGGSRAEVLAQAWAGGDPRELPVRTTLLPQATWLLDEAAAADLR